MGAGNRIEEWPRRISEPDNLSNGDEDRSKQDRPVHQNPPATTGWVKSTRQLLPRWTERCKSKGRRTT